MVIKQLSEMQRNTQRKDGICLRGTADSHFAPASCHLHPHSNPTSRSLFTPSLHLLVTTLPLQRYMGTCIGEGLRNGLSR
jgi:hypothetical protein